MKQPLKILTWHVHGNYLYYLSQANCLFYLPVKNPAESGYIGRSPTFPWGKNVKEIPATDVKNMQFDCILFQSNYNPTRSTQNFFEDQVTILSDDQLRNTPKVFLEHDPPRNHPTDTKHLLYNSSIPLVHVTSFNQLMWDCGRTQTTVIEHGVTMPPNRKTLRQKQKGVIVINNLSQRGRRLGLDIFETVRREIPLDLIGMGSESLGGLGEISPSKLPSVLSEYRFFFYPARYTSLSLSLIEAMMVGLPIVTFATTELPTVIENEKNGYVSTSLPFLIEKMKLLLSDETLALRLGKAAKQTAQNRFSIQRFVSDWEQFLKNVVMGATQKMRDFPTKEVSALL